MKINIKKLQKDAIIPTRGSASAAGYDLYAYVSDEDDMVDIAPHQTLLIKTGIAVAIPEGYFGGIFARSGLATKQGLRPANCVGVIDSDYRGEIMVAVHNDSDQTKTIQDRERIAQLVVIPYLSCEFDEVDELDDTVRGVGGFGSSGK